VAISQKLRPYQLEAARAILQSVHEHRGLTISVEIARQGGKNELSAQLEVLLLTLHLSSGGQLVKCSPSFKPQTVNSMIRLKERLNDAGYASLWSPELGYMIRLGKARAIFFSADESANVVGATASILLEVDESQDVNADKYNKDFRPMGSTTNCTTVHYGTAWDDTCLLEQVKQANLELERKDGVRRHFEYDWQVVAKYNPNYAAYVEAERERLGPDHPLFTTQYELKPLHGGGGFLSDQQLAQIRGDHPRRRHYSEIADNPVIVAAIDVAGEDEEAEGEILRSAQPQKDSTVVTIAALYPAAQTIEGGPDLTRIQILEHYYRTGVQHAALHNQLVDLLKNVWPCRRVVIDATGVGRAVSSFLSTSLGRQVVIPFVFSAQSKSQLAYDLLAAINSGRLKMYNTPAEEELLFWSQMKKAKSAVRANKTLNFFVNPEEGHDDFLMSTALLVQAANAYRPRKAQGRK